jgi:hypothetical protein
MVSLPAFPFASEDSLRAAAKSPDGTPGKPFYLGKAATERELFESAKKAAAFEPSGKKPTEFREQEEERKGNCVGVHPIEDCPFEAVDWMVRVQ